MSFEFLKNRVASILCIFLCFSPSFFYTYLKQRTKKKNDLIKLGLPLKEQLVLGP